MGSHKRAKKEANITTQIKASAALCLRSNSSLISLFRLGCNEIFLRIRKIVSGALVVDGLRLAGRKKTNSVKPIIRLVQLSSKVESNRVASVKIVDRRDDFGDELKVLTGHWRILLVCLHINSKHASQKIKSTQLFRQLFQPPLFGFDSFRFPDR